MMSAIVCGDVFYDWNTMISGVDRLNENLKIVEICE